MPSNSILGTVFKIGLFGGCKMKGEISGSTFPRNQKELHRAGEKWLTLVLQQNGTLASDVEVESLTLEEFNNGGLLGELCIINIKYSGDTDAPTKMMAKFSPSDFETKVTTALFDICEHEFDFYRTVQPGMQARGLRCPKMVYGDFNRYNNTFIMILEFIEADFYKIQQTDSLSDGRDEIVFKQLAKLHTSFWGGQQPSIAFVPPMNEGAAKLLPAVTKKHIKTFYSGLCKEESSKIPPEMRAMLKEICGPKEGGLNKIMDHFANSEWLTMFHGDPRIDNWFFDEKNKNSQVVEEEDGPNVGILDWQLMNKGFSGNDLSWLFCTTIDLETEKQQARGKELVQIYYDELVSLGAVDSSTMKLEEFEEDMALAHLLSMAKIIIGAGGLDNNDTNTVEVMTIECRRAVLAMEAHGTLDAFGKFKAGTLISQTKKRA